MNPGNTISSRAGPLEVIGHSTISADNTLSTVFWKRCIVAARVGRRKTAAARGRKRIVDRGGVSSNIRLVSGERVLVYYVRNALAYLDATSRVAEVEIAPPVVVGQIELDFVIANLSNAIGDE